MTDRIDVIISCTRKDLTPHIAEAKSAIEQCGMHALVQENMPAQPADAITVSLAMVDEAEVYLGIVAHRYGYVPDDPRNPDQRSITEMEYRRAVERGIPVLICFMHDDHDVKVEMVEMGDAATKLKRFKGELSTAYVAAFFTSPAELGKQVLHALYELRGKLDLGIPDAPAPGTLADLGPLPHGSRVSMPRYPHFVGREDSLLALAETLLHGPADAKTVITPATAATGSGGIGKTQLAVEFAHRYGRYFMGVHWINLLGVAGDTLNAHLRAEIGACGAAMDIPNFPQDDLPAQAQMTLAEWRKSPPRLIILDNAETPDVVRDALKTLAGARVLVTSRWMEDGDWRDIGVTPRGLDTLTRAQSIELLRKLAPHLQDIAEPDLDALALRLGDFPLALHLAGSYLHQMRRVGLTVADYTARLDRDGLAHPSLRDWAERARQSSPTGHDMNVARSFGLSWAKVDDPLACRLFRACGYLAPNTPIPFELLIALAQTPEELEEETPPSEETQEALALAQGQLVQYGLLAPHAEQEHLLAIHPLLADFARGLDAEEDENARQLARVARALNSLTYAALNTGLPATFVPLRPHVEVVAPRADAAENEDAAVLWNNLGYHLKMIADFAGARQHYERALAIDVHVHGPEHSRVAIWLNNLGLLLKTLGDLPAARQHYERALAIDERVYGLDHPDVAIDLNNLGLLLKTLGDLPAAHQHLERALAIDERVYGPDHPNVAIRLNNLGTLLRDLGDLPTARQHYERALAIWEQALGAEHPQVATGHNNLGSLLQDLGDLPAARQHLERALAIDERVYGPDHPDVAIDLNNLGLL
ncbi:MAG: tetratricopeptide repeat protein, partial [Anaerolineae bacterium]|nr:tetratricopeptide repeat protein [Anaerolineae bacterium]